jgi:hypothetical protein
MLRTHCADHLSDRLQLAGELVVRPVDLDALSGEGRNGIDLPAVRRVVWAGILHRLGQEGIVEGIGLIIGGVEEVLDVPGHQRDGPEFLTH